MAVQNQLVQTLPRRDRARFVAACERVQLQHAQVIAVQGEPLRQIHFPLDSSISMTVQTDDHPALEVGLIGFEGMLGSQWLLGGSTAPTHAVVQGTGGALRIASPAFTRELEHSVALRSVLGRYLGVRIEQLALSVACRRFHALGPRLARWLLMSQDRATSGPLHVTHEVLARMLGVRRVGITVAAGELQRRGLITYHRGELEVLDRAGLEASACSCYASDCRSYRLRMG